MSNMASAKFLNFNPGVLSFDPEKVKLLGLNGSRVIAKYTSSEEYQQMCRVSAYLDKHLLSVTGARVLTVPILSWDPVYSVLTTEFCDGINLEHALRRVGEKVQRFECITFFRELLRKMREQGFLWGDCAPRNMILCGNTLRIVDFERSLALLGHAVDPPVFSRFFRDYSYEEFSCFLFREEQDFLFKEFLTPELEREEILVSLISSKRKRALLAIRFGNKISYGIQEVEEVENIMADVATPFLVNEKPFYPMETIEYITTNGGKYADIIFRIHPLDSINRFFELQNIASAL